MLQLFFSFASCKEEETRLNCIFLLNYKKCEGKRNSSTHPRGEYIKKKKTAAVDSCLNERRSCERLYNFFFSIQSTGAVDDIALRESMGTEFSCI